jgi:LPS-assembly protein
MTRQTSYSQRWYRPAIHGLASVLLGLALVSPVAASSLLPDSFFHLSFKPGEGNATVEADELSYDAQKDQISAVGSVVFGYNGYVIKADRLDYNQKSGQLLATGNVDIVDEGKNHYTLDRLEFAGGMKEAFLQTLTLTTAKGVKITAKDIHYVDQLQTILTDAAYSPCGLCVDSKGRRIGWQVKAAKITYDRENASISFEQPSLAILGIPVAWLPWFWIPDPSQPRAMGLRSPSTSSDERYGYAVTTPFFVPFGKDIDVLLSPTLMSRQGLLASGQMNWRISNVGSISFRAAGIYQLDQGAYSGSVGDRAWRGALQSFGHFTPLPNWNVGWSYSAFTDRAFLGDYALSEDESSTNEAYASYRTDQTWLDARVQKFTKLGNYDDVNDMYQGINLPKVKFTHVQDLQSGWGRLNFSGELLSVERELNQTRTRYVNGVKHTYVFGYAGYKQHLELEGAWENQWILPGGVTATPYVGLRMDEATYDGTSTLPSSPGNSSLFALTPIAAIDMRYPLVATNGADTHVVEPIAQLVYRGSDTTFTGITNEDSQSFVFDESNVFSYNRFSGIDRQETGLRANVGAHYTGNFADGSWVDAIVGESFHLLGTNSLGVVDSTGVGSDDAVEDAASYLVGGIRAGFSDGLNGAAKVQFDPSTVSVTRGGFGVGWNYSLISGDLSYIYLAAQPEMGVGVDQHEVDGNIGVPMFDYWRATAGLTYNIQNLQWTEARAGLTYDDGYLRVSGNLTASPNDFGWGIHLGLKGPDGQFASF